MKSITQFLILTFLNFTTIPVFCCPTAWAVNQYLVGCVVPNGTCGGIAAQTSSKGDIIIAAAYETPGDGGGGTFVDIGLCDSTGAYAAKKYTKGATQITLTTGTSVAGLAVGTLLQNSEFQFVTSSGTQYSQIVAINANTNTITVSIPAQADNNTVGETLLTLANNTATLLLNGNGAPKDCVLKSGYRGDPHEWGAKGDGNTVDATALQNWLAGPGPWDATTPATYITNTTLNCWPNMHIRAPSNDSHPGAYGVTPIVTIRAASPFTVGSQSAVIVAENYCHITGLAIDAVDTGTTDSGLDALDIDSTNNSAGVIVDGHSLLENGHYNLYCNSSGGSPGMQIKDSQFGPSWNDNIHIGSCANSRFIGDLIAKAGLNSISGSPGWINDGHPAGLYFSGDELTLIGGVIEESIGAGLVLDTAQKVSVTGMYIDGSGDTETGWSPLDVPGLLINGTTGNKASDISICGNHFNRNDGVQNSATGAHIRFTGYTTDVSLCGNVYQPNNQNGFTATVPTFVYDAATGASLAKTTLYENPRLQTSTTSIFSTGATNAGLPNKQVCPTGGC